ncbi:WxL protein peptidoglycan domain-containing protein [Streptomyces sp. NPDC005017]|uniref:WxL protein peptidoglycan domain-containing protein n=1 Tax=Streptomyces sp. NPDC005017 TaxID=3364706 RepID=UPI0036AD6321
MITSTARRIAAVLAACVLAVLPAAGAAAAAPDAVPGDAGRAGEGRVTFGVQPSAARKPDARPNFSYGATPGARVLDHIAVVNYGRKPLTLRVYAQDAFTTADGGFDLFAARHRPDDVGSWIRLRENRVKIPARGRAIVPFTMTVPAKATPGDHVGGIVASLSAGTKDAKGNDVALDQRVGARVYLRVAGELSPRLSVENLRTEYHGDANPFGTGDATVTYTVRNTGNVRLAARQKVEVRDGLGGAAKAGKVPALPELLPGDSVTFRTTATGVLPAFRDRTTVTVDPLPVKGDIKHRVLPRVTRTEAFTAVPWAFLGLLLALALLTAALLLRRIRRRRAARAPLAPVGGRTREAVGLAAAALLAATMIVAGTPGDARAADGGKLGVTPAEGSDTQPITLTAAGPCPARTRNVIARVKGAGFPPEGQIVVGNAPITTYGQAPGGGPAIPLTFTLRDYATTAGFTDLRGTYTFTVSCLEAPFELDGVKDFTGSLTFRPGKAGKAYEDGTEVAPPKNPAPAPPAGGATPAPDSGAGATGAQGQQPRQPGGIPVPGSVPPGGDAAAQGAAQPRAAATAADGGPSVWSLAGFGVFALALAAGAALWLRGRRTPAG